MWKPTKNQNSFKIVNYNPTLVNKDEYNFGKTISSSQTVLKYSGDELKPYAVKSNIKSWPVTNKIIDIKKPGMYKITLDTKYLENPTMTKWIYVSGEKWNPLDISNFKIDKTNFAKLPESDQGPINKLPGTKNEDLDNDYPYKANFIIDMPDFLMDRYFIEYSLLWYSEFQKLNSNITTINKEGKYKINITDIFGNQYSQNLLILNKNLSLDARNKLMISPIFTDENKPDETAFYKGTMVWNYWRYEDEDHAIWEHDEFIKNAIKNGLTPKQAENLYKKWKKNPTNGNKPDWKGWDPNDWRNKHDPLKNNNKNPKNLTNKLKNFKKRNTLTGIIVGSTTGGSLLLAGLIFIIFKRYRNRKIT